MRHRIQCVFFAAVCCLALPARSATIHSTFGPGESFSPTSYIPVNFYTSPEVIGTSLAFAFDVPTGSDYRLEEVRIAASWAGSKKNAAFWLFEDARGLPATTPLALLAEGPADLGMDPSVLSLPAPGPLGLTAGQRYWLVIEPASLDASVPADDFVELWLGAGAIGYQTSRSSFDSGPWGDWFSPSFESEAPAFSVEAEPIPEPGTLLLLGIGLALLPRPRGSPDPRIGRGKGRPRFGHGRLARSLARAMREHRWPARPTDRRQLAASSQPESSGMATETVSGESEKAPGAKSPMKGRMIRTPPTMSSTPVVESSR